MQLYYDSDDSDDSDTLIVNKQQIPLYWIHIKMKISNTDYIVIKELHSLPSTIDKKSILIELKEKMDGIIRDYLVHTFSWIVH